MRIIFFLFALYTLLYCNKIFAQEQQGKHSLFYDRDSALFYEKVLELKGISIGSTSILLSEVGRSFIEYPYVGKTLETGNDEKLVVNLREFDCTTLVESCLAFSLTLKSGDVTFSNYKQILKKIRYRDGIIDSYNSRLHYFTDWITNNQKKGFVTDTTKYFNGVAWQKQIDFMSTHAGYYKQLINDSNLIPGIREIEKEISGRTYFYIAKDSIAAIEPKLEEGMIVAITTNINGLDIAHTGMLVKENGQIHLLHASSDAAKVVISEKTFSEYLSGNKRQTGVMLLKVK
jgi:hypothetical protein